MTNTKAGEIQIPCGGETYNFKFGALGLSELEEKTGKPIATIFAELEDEQNRRIKDIGLVFWSGLRRHHPEVTEDKAMEIVDDLGIPAVTQYFEQAIAIAFPASEGDEDSGNAKAGNRKARRAAKAKE